jgi:hypothetical protein
MGSSKFVTGGWRTAIFRFCQFQNGAQRCAEGPIGSVEPVGQREKTRIPYTFKLQLNVQKPTELREHSP